MLIKGVCFISVAVMSDKGGVKFSSLLTPRLLLFPTQLKDTQINIGPAHCAVQAPSTNSTVPDTIPPAGEAR
jgi:hypothetical protein